MTVKYFKRRVFSRVIFCAILISFCVSCSSSDTDVAIKPPCTTCKTFVTTAAFNGDIKTAGGQTTAIASADALCMADTNKPAGGGTYKAMLVDGTNRVACTSALCITNGTSEHIDWVLKPNTTYYRADGTTLVFTTNANGIWDFVASDMSHSFDTATSAYWTGLDSQWESILTQMCGGDWSSSLNTDVGDTGTGDRVNNGAIGGGAWGCNNNTDLHLLCVEQ